MIIRWNLVRIITINHSVTSIVDLPLIITISDICKNQATRIDSDNTIDTRLDFQIWSNFSWRTTQVSGYFINVEYQLGVIVPLYSQSWVLVLTIMSTWTRKPSVYSTHVFKYSPVITRGPVPLKLVLRRTLQLLRHALELYDFFFFFP